MKILRFISLCLLIGLTGFPLFAQSSKPNSQNEVRLTSSNDTVQYSLGAYLGQWLIKNGFSITNQAVFKRGMDDATGKKKLAVPDTLIAPLVTSYQLSVQNARSRVMEEQLFSALRGKSGVGALPDGVHYIVLKSGNGIRASVQDTVVFNAIGVFPDGTVFEDTFRKKQPVKTAVSNLIPGLNETVQLMPVGSVWRIFIPSVLAYGPAGLQNIVPPNTALVFEVTLEEVRKGK